MRIMAGTDKEEYAILVVDDEETILDVAEGFFYRKGYQVHTASNGREALEILDREKVHCCFTDISMPEMDGLELAEAIRKKDNTLPVVVMTGYPSLENTIQTLKNGVVDYLIKPINLEQMEITLNRVVRERSLFVENLILREEVERQDRLRELNSELISRVDEVNTVNRIMEDFSDSESSYQIFDTVVNLGLQVLKADWVHFYIWTEQDHSLVPVASAYAAGNPGSEESGLSGESISGQTIPFIRKVLTTDRKPCLVTKESGKEGLPEEISSFMAVPLNIRDKVFGVASAIALGEDRSFDEKDIYYMTFITRKAAGAIENIALYENIYDNLFSTLYAFVATLEARDQYTREHSTRVAKLAYRIAGAYGCTEEELDVINFAGRLHDIGKIGIRDDILLKPGRLTDGEYEKARISWENSVCGTGNGPSSVTITSGMTAGGIRTDWRAKRFLFCPGSSLWRMRMTPWPRSGRTEEKWKRRKSSKLSRPIPVPSLPRKSSRFSLRSSTGTRHNRIALRGVLKCATVDRGWWHYEKSTA